MRPEKEASKKPLKLSLENEESGRVTSSKITYDILLTTQTPTDVCLLACLRKGECFRKGGWLYEVDIPSWESVTNSVRAIRCDDFAELFTGSVYFPVERIPRETYEAEQVLWAMKKQSDQKKRLQSE
jgi:hypothetical protein